MNNLYKKFKKRVKEIRLQKKISQDDLAKLPNVHRTYISGVERGIRNPSLQNIKRIAKALALTIKDLFD